MDTAVRSCGFTTHTIFDVWGGEMTADSPIVDPGLGEITKALIDFARQQNSYFL